MQRPHAGAEGDLADRRGRTAAAIRLPLAPLRGRPERRLRQRADHAGRVHPVGNGRRRAAHHRRVRVRRHPRGPPRRPRSRPTAAAGPSRSNWCGSTSPWGSGCERDARGGSAVPLFNALGDDNRLRIVVRLCDGGPSSTSQVTQAVPVTRQAATKHLELLEAAGLVTSSRRGRERVWTLQTRAADRSQRLPQPAVPPLGRRDRPVARLRRGLSCRRPPIACEGELSRG